MKPETVTYARRDGRELLIDVYRPERPPKAAVIMLHGGGWYARTTDRFEVPRIEVADWFKRKAAE